MANEKKNNDKKNNNVVKYVHFYLLEGLEVDEGPGWGDAEDSGVDEGSGWGDAEDVGEESGVDEGWDESVLRLKGFVKKVQSSFHSSGRCALCL